LRPRTPARTDWLTRFKIGRLARTVAQGIARELPNCTVAGKAVYVGETWAVRLIMPPGICSHSFAAGMRSEGLPCLPAEDDGTVYLPLCTSYSAEDAEHVVLGAAKVAYYLARDTDTETALTLPSPAGSG